MRSSPLVSSFLVTLCLFVYLYVCWLALPSTVHILKLEWLCKSTGRTKDNTYPLVRWLIPKDYSTVEVLRCTKLGLPMEGEGCETISLSHIP